MFKLINGGNRLPERATRYSCGFDVFANEDVTIGAGETKLIGLGICISEDSLHKMLCELGVDFPDHWFKMHYLELHPRSSLRAKGISGGVGIIDMDFINLEIKMVITNPLTIGYDGDFDYKVFGIKRGDKIGQLILKRHEGYLLPSEYSKDEERSGGWGSTGL